MVINNAEVRSLLTRLEYWKAHGNGMSDCEAIVSAIEGVGSMTDSEAIDALDTYAREDQC